MRPIEFLFNVWDHSCKDGDFVFLSTKSRGKWKDHPFEYKRGIKNDLKDFFSDYPASEHDIYFCPLPFVGKRRLKNLVSRVNILWSDIDHGKAKIKPSILWESSPGRLQALWFLKSTLTNEEGEKLNRDLTYYMDADKGGWDLSQVLRVPGTRNHKYKTLPSVRILDYDWDLGYRAGQLRRRIGSVETEPKVEGGLDFKKVLSKYRRKIPPRVKRLLMEKHVAKGNRSDILWYLEHKLNDAGLSAEEILVLIKNSAWNKYKGRGDEDKRLTSEMSKIIEKKTDTPSREEVEEEVEEEDSVEMVVESYQDIMGSMERPPGWLVKGFWMKGSHGIIAGEPKTFKSTLAMDLAVSVASGKDFLGKYPVESTGSVVYIQNENAKWIIKDRLQKIAASRGLLGKIRKKGKRFHIDWPDDLPIHFINQQSFLLTDPLHQDIMEQTLRDYKPQLIILDPLYLMFDGDINSAKDLNHILSWLLEMRFKYNCGVVVIHHYNKGGQNAQHVRGGQRMLGSTTLHGWIESAWYISAKEDVVSMEREFRGAGLHPRLDLKVEMEDFGELGYSISEVEKEDIADVVLRYINQFESGVTEASICQELDISRSELKRLIEIWKDQQKITKIKGKIRPLLLD